MYSKNLEYVTKKVLGAGGGQTLEEFESFPRYIKLETTNNCTARCVMCGIEEWRKVMRSDYMDDDLFYKIADEIIEHKHEVIKVALFVGNEPLLDKKLAQRIKYFKDHGIKVNFSTNGSLMTKEKAIEILESGVDHVNFSIDGLDKVVYEKMRKPLKFEEVLGNTLQFIALRDKFNFKCIVRVSVIKSSHLVKKVDIDRVCGFWNKILDKEKGDSVRIDDLIEIHATKDSNLNDFLYDEEEILLKANKTPCYILWNTITIKCDGSVALCNVDQCRTWRGGGDLRAETIAQVWKNGKKSSIMESHLHDGRGSVEMCKNCLSWL